MYGGGPYRPNIYLYIYIYTVGGESGPKKGLSEGEPGPLPVSGFPRSSFALVFKGFRGRFGVRKNSVPGVCIRSQIVTSLRRGIGVGVKGVAGSDAIDAQ